MTTKQRKTLGILLLVGPMALLMFALSAYAVVTFTIASIQADTNSGIQQESMLGVPYAHAQPLTQIDYTSGDILSGSVEQSSDTDPVTRIGQLLRVALGFIGVIALFGIMIGTPIGIYLLATAGKDQNDLSHRTIKKLEGLMRAFGILAITSFIMELLSTSNTNFTALAALLSSAGWIVYFFWIGRAAYNLQIHSKKHLSASPVWLVWGHLVPFYNLVHRLVTYPRFWKEVAEHAQLNVADQQRGNAAAWIVGLLPLAQIVVTIGLFYIGITTPDTFQTTAPPLVSTFGVISLGITLATSLSLISFTWFVTSALEKKS